ncbi:DUF1837 domain-containing protein [Cytobacillus pseudoceanisediminis]|uniref:DUF1837 domain-containing protein n=1 Tax=Cytobacillus pseudoceanisediminis TaxID=3051614 RepID=A0ABZ2ZN53_9BACI
MLETNIGEKFLGLFYHDIKDHELVGCNSRVNLHVLRIANNKFDYSNLVYELYDSIITYCLSPRELEELAGTPGGKKFFLAVNKLKEHENNDGELGEILLYCLLESHLKAPKIMTKMELKTSSSDYVKGADGIHLLQLNDSDFHLIFGESKLNKKFQRGLYEAFKSIDEYIKRPKNNINDEVLLINSHLIKEAITDEQYKYLKKIIIPSAQDDELNTDRAFGIFIGFDLELEDADWLLPNKTFRQKVRKLIVETVEKEYQYIENKVKEKGLHGYTFYIFALPFFELDITRKKVIENLKGASNDF